MGGNQPIHPENLNKLLLKCHQKLLREKKSPVMQTEMILTLLIFFALLVSSCSAHKLGIMAEVVAGDMTFKQLLEYISSPFTPVSASDHAHCLFDHTISSNAMTTQLDLNSSMIHNMVKVCMTRILRIGR